MLIYTKVFDSQLGQHKLVGTEMDIMYRSAVDTVADLPTSDNVEGDLRMCLDSDHFYAYVSGAWHDQGVLDVGDLLQ
ncbi:MAG: hypothetical protein EHM34_08945, partial [Nitrosopumilales archaeon]